MKMKKIEKMQKIILKYYFQYLSLWKKMMIHLLMKNLKNSILLSKIWLLNYAGINFNSNKVLSSIKPKSNNTNSFIKFPEKLEPSKQKDIWENKKVLEQKIQQDFRNDEKNRIQ